MFAVLNGFGAGDAVVLQVFDGKNVRADGEVPGLKAAQIMRKGDENAVQARSDNLSARRLCCYAEYNAPRSSLARCSDVCFVTVRMMPGQNSRGFCSVSTPPIFREARLPVHQSWRYNGNAKSRSALYHSRQAKCEANHPQNGFQGGGCFHHKPFTSSDSVLTTDRIQNGTRFYAIAATDADLCAEAGGGSTDHIPMRWRSGQAMRLQAECRSGFQGRGREIWVRWPSAP